MTSEIEKAARILQEGGLVAFPTETVYGLGADATNVMAVARVFEAKDRPQFDPLIVHVADLRQAQILALRFPRDAVRLAEKFWPGPLTLVLPKGPLIPDLVTASLPSVALRVPDHPLALGLIQASGRPIAAPSANPFGAVSPTTAAHVRESLGDKVDLVLDGGPCAVGVESTVVSFTGDRPLLLRPGGLALEEIEALLGPVEVVAASQSLPQAPGQLERHYAPRTPLTLVEAVPSLSKNERAGLLWFGPPQDLPSFKTVVNLSPQGDLREAAANLFSSLRRLDALGLDRLYALQVPGTGLGRAINDRLRRAAHR
ncbi:MAG TPA: L-threonylcarbamoyladenylate synthase [bacterium]|nr:L-threonylcarbamoyladenylate synthase [bacterium]